MWTFHVFVWVSEVVKALHLMTWLSTCLFDTLHTLLMAKGKPVGLDVFRMPVATICRFCSNIDVWWSRSDRFCFRTVLLSPPGTQKMDDQPTTRPTKSKWGNEIHMTSYDVVFVFGIFWNRLRHVELRPRAQCCWHPKFFALHYVTDCWVRGQQSFGMKQPVVNADNVVDLIQLSGYGTSPPKWGVLSCFISCFIHILPGAMAWKSIGGLLGLGGLAANRKATDEIYLFKVLPKRTVKPCQANLINLVSWWMDFQAASPMSV